VSQGKTPITAAMMKMMETSFLFMPWNPMLFPRFWLLVKNPVFYPVTSNEKRGTSN
jgi:hypothetical protein